MFCELFTAQNNLKSKRKKEFRASSDERALTRIRRPAWEPAECFHIKTQPYKTSSPFIRNVLAPEGALATRTRALACTCIGVCDRVWVIPGSMFPPSSLVSGCSSCVKTNPKDLVSSLPIPFRVLSALLFFSWIPSRENSESTRFDGEFLNIFYSPWSPRFSRTYAWRCASSSFTSGSREIVT